MGFIGAGPVLDYRHVRARRTLSSVLRPAVELRGGAPRRAGVHVLPALQRAARDRQRVL